MASDQHEIVQRFGEAIDRVADIAGTARLADQRASRTLVAVVGGWPVLQSDCGDDDEFAEKGVAAHLVRLQRHSPLMMSKMDDE